MTSTYIGSTLADRLFVRSARNSAALRNLTVGMARVMDFTVNHSGVGIWRIGSDYFIATCPGVTLEGFPFTEISEPIRNLRDARDWLGY